MKKTIVLAAIALSIVACKKSEMANQNSSETENTSVVAKENSNVDSAALSVNEDVKIDKEVAQKVHEKVMNETNKSIDSLAKTSQIIPEVIDETPPEAEEKKVVKNPVKPQVIRETKLFTKKNLLQGLLL